jgi:hypothetical protein
MSSIDPSTRPAQLTGSAQIPLHGPEIDFDPALEARAVAVVNEFFPGPVEIEENFDPSEPDRRWRVILVYATGTDEELLAKEAAWRKRALEQFTPDEIWRYTLLVVPRS